MAVKTFAVGEVLTASDTNTYLNNGGLVYVTSFAIPTSPAQSSVVISNCFSSTYDNYRIIMAGGTQSSQQRLTVTLGSSTTGYYEGLFYINFSGATSGTASTNNGSGWVYIAGGNTNSAGFIMDLQNPYLAQYTQMNAVGALQTAQATWDQGIHAVATSYTGFTITPQGSTLTGGTVTVYGYRKA